MNNSIIIVLRMLYHKHYIGAKHTPEDWILKIATRQLNKKQRREFRKEYKQIQIYLIRLQKKTSKGSDWHISINPKCVKKVKEILGI